MCDGAILDDDLLGDLLRNCCVLYDCLLNYSHGSDVFLNVLLNNNKWLPLVVVVVVVVVGGGGLLLLVVLYLELISQGLLKLVFFHATVPHHSLHLT